MLSVLRNRTYRHLFTAQVIALVGTGLATVALGLLAYDISGPRAGSVLGTALAIKMVAFVGIAPAIGAIAHRIPRRALLVGSDLTRAAVALMLPFVDQVWQVYVLIFALQAASAAFTPTFQAVIPDVLPEERDYTQALSMSRLAYDLESLFSPALAAALLGFMTYNWLFLGTVGGFLASAALVVSAVLPKPAPAPERTAGVYAKASAGSRLFFRVPRLRALLCLNLAVAAASALVTVNTVVYVRDHLDRSTGDVAFALGAYGAGSMLVALVLPRVLDRVADRTVMLRGGLLLTVVFAAVGVITSASGGSWRWPALLGAWAAFGAACSMVLTPTGRLIRRSAPPEERTPAFAAQFSLSHAAWLLTYPLAGWVGASAGLLAAVVALGLIGLIAAVSAVWLWPARDAADTPPRPHHTGARPPSPAGCGPGPGRLASLPQPRARRTAPGRGERAPLNHSSRTRPGPRGRRCPRGPAHVAKGPPRVAVTGKHGESEAMPRRVRHLFVNRANLRAALVKLVNATFAAATRCGGVPAPSALPTVASSAPGPRT